MKDLFGATIDAQGKTVETCQECDRAMIVTESGFKSCPMGHGKLQIPKEMRPAKIQNVAFPCWSKP